MTNLESALISVAATLLVGLIFHVLSTRGLRRQIQDVKEQNGTLAEALAGGHTLLKELEVRIPTAVAPFVTPGQEPRIREAVRGEVAHVVQDYRPWASIVQLFGPLGMTTLPEGGEPITDVSAKQALGPQVLGVESPMPPS